MPTCERFRFWDSETVIQPAGERFYAAGEERAELRLPDGYGYPIEAADPNWGIVCMFMNHRATDDQGFVQYKVTVDDENSLPHVRVMGIFIVYVAPDSSVTTKCGALPSDLTTLRTERKGRRGPIPYEIPLTGFDNHGKAVDVKAPPGGLEKLRGRKLRVIDRFFLQPNVQVERGTRLRWEFNSDELHNVTLANGPAARLSHSS